MVDPDVTDRGDEFVAVVPAASKSAVERSFVVWMSAAIWRT